MVAVNNTLAETECKLKHQAKTPGRAPCKVTQVGPPNRKMANFSYSLILMVSISQPSLLLFRFHIHCNDRNINLP
jgi:hypothetical protein